MMDLFESARNDLAQRKYRLGLPDSSRKRDKIAIWIRICMIIVILVAASFPSVAASQSQLEQNNSYGIDLLYHTGGGAQAVTVGGQFAYVGFGPELAILSLADPTRPVRVGQVVFSDTATLAAIAVSGKYVYVVGSNGGLHVIDVTDPAAPQSIGFSPSRNGAPSQASDIALTGGYVCVTYGDSLGGIEIFQVTDPANLKSIALYSSNESYGSVALSGHYAYIAAFFSGLIVLDISDPAKPAFVSSFGLPGVAISLAISGSYVYLGTSLGMIVLDISNPASPVEIGSFITGTGVFRIGIAGDLAYLVDGFGLRILNITDPTAPIGVGAYLFGGNGLIIGGIALSMPLVYMAASDFIILDVSHPANPSAVWISTDTKPVTGYAATLVGSYLYITDWTLNILDISTPEKPVLVSSTPTDFGYISAVSGSYAYCAGGSGVNIVDISNPITPTLVGEYTLEGVTRIVIDGDLAYVASSGTCSRAGCYGGGLSVLDVADPTNPVSLGFYQVDGANWNVAEAGGFAYLSSPDMTRLFDVRNSENILLMRTYPGWMIFYVDREHAYAETSDYLLILDLSDPANPRQVGRYPLLDNYAADIVASGSYVYLKYPHAIQALDVSIPWDPFPVGEYAFEYPQESGAMAVSGETIYIAGYGLFTLRFDPPDFIYRTFFPLFQSSGVD
jgi:hypothetical protein